MLSGGGWPKFPDPIGKIYTSSALNPLLWLCGLITLPAWTLATFAAHGFWRAALYILGTIPPACALVAYFRLLFTDPDRLQSERFQLTRQQYQMIGDDRHRGQIVDVASEIVTNPISDEDRGSNGT